MKHFLIFFVLIFFAESVSNIDLKHAIEFSAIDFNAVELSTIEFIPKKIPPKRAIAIEQLDCLIQNAYYEAFGEGVIGVLLVTQVVLNRAQIKKTSYCSVVFEKYQFSWTLTTPGIIKEKDRLFLEKLIIEFYTGRRHIPEEFKTATHFHANYVRPYWANKLEFLGSWKNHLFYKEEIK
jgi:spore germination cell wall hydrolase CwlJ-like protein